MEGVGPREDTRMIVIVVTVYGELILGGPLDGSRLVELNSTCGGGGILNISPEHQGGPGGIRLEAKSKQPLSWRDFRGYTILHSHSNV